jgi:CcmD family protein
MKAIHALVAAVVLVILMGTGASLATAAAQPPEQQGEFIPLDQLPPQDQLPAAPLLIGAYVFVPVVLFLYLVTLSRRMSSVQREVERLEADIRRSRA